MTQDRRPPNRETPTPVPRPSDGDYGDRAQKPGRVTTDQAPPSRPRR